MREGQFIKQNIDRWKSYETPADGPDELAERFTNLVDDLSYAKTFYPFSNTIRYINNMAARMYLSIYRNRKMEKNRLITFWTTELPLLMRKHRRTLLFSFLFFAVFVIIGVLSAYKDETFIRAVMGDQYVDMTEHNIASGDPFGVYKQGNSVLMYIKIAFNNISVSFSVFAAGLLATVGTLFFMFTNGLMLGAFEYMFFRHGLGFKSILVVFTHGTLEISALVISGCAGMVLGNSLLFPRTFTRLQSLKAGAKDGVKISVGLVPIYMIAAFFESFVTRHTEVPVILSLCILGGSLAFIVWYFILYPIKVSKRREHVSKA